MLLNQPRAMAWLDQYGLDALIATSWVNILYCSGYYLWLQPVFKEYMASPGGSNDNLPLFAILPRHGNAALVVDQSCELNSAECWVPNRYVFGTPRATQADQPATVGTFVRSPHRFNTAIESLAAALHDERLDSARIGLDTETLSLARHAAIKAALPQVTFCDASNLFRLIRMVKSEEELRRLRRAAEINEQAAAECLALAAVGCQIQDVVQAFRLAAAAAGADFDHFAFSQQGIGVATENSYCLSDRETMFVDFGCVYQHYYSDAGTTLIVGRPSNRALATYRVLVDCLAEAAVSLQPGVKASQIQACMQRSFEAGGLPGCFPHGHGIGIELRDYPILAPDAGQRIHDDCLDISADIPLENGMVVNLEAPIFDWGRAALQLEQTYVVTPSGGQPLTNRDLSQPVMVE